MGGPSVTWEPLGLPSLSGEAHSVQMVPVVILSPHLPGLPSFCLEDRMCSPKWGLLWAFRLQTQGHCQGRAYSGVTGEPS